MSLESNVCRLLVDVREVSENAIIANLLAAKSVGELSIDDAGLQAMLAIVKKTLQISFDAGITQVPLILKSK